MSQPSIETWKTPEVVAFLHRNDLEALAPIFEENEVTGLDLVMLTEDELRSMLNLSKLQAAKIKRLVDNAGPEAQEDDPAATHNFHGAEIPKVSDRPEDLGDDEEEREELRRAWTGGRGGSTSAEPSRAAAAATPAAGVPAVQGPTLPTGTGALQLDANTVARYQRSVDTISRYEVEGVQQQLPGVRSRLAATKKRLALQQAKFEELRAEEAKRNEKLDKLKDGKWYPGKYILGKGKREEKLQRNTDKLEKVSNQVRASGAQLEELHKLEEKDTALVKELTAKCAELAEARGFCAELLQSAFAGALVGDARENALESEVAQLGPKLEEVRRYKSVYGKAYEMIKGAREALEQACQLLESASRLATADMVQNVFSPAPMMNGPGGLMIDMVKRARWRQAVELCKASGQLAIKARALVPDMPRVKGEKLEKLKIGFGLMDVVFDNMISDMIVARKIRDMLSLAYDTLSDIKFAERWLEGWLRGRIDEDMRNLEALLATRRAELHNHRMQLMHAWIDAKARGAVHEAPPPQPGYPAGYPPPQHPAGVVPGHPVHHHYVV